MTGEQLAKLRLEAARQGAVCHGLPLISFADIVAHIDAQAARNDDLLRGQLAQAASLNDQAVRMQAQASDLRRAVSALFDARERGQAVVALQAHRDELLTFIGQQHELIQTLMLDVRHARLWANFWQQNWGDMQNDPDIAERASDGWQVGEPVLPPERPAPTTEETR